MAAEQRRHAAPWQEPALRQAAALARSPNLPVDAVLCIRRLRARLDVEGLRHVGGLLGAADQFSRQLQRHASEARRPARELVPEGAEAVLFDNPAEMLACAALDWLDGQFYRRWWWRSLLDGGALAQGVVTLWRRYPIYVQEALAQLATRADEFRRRLPAPDAEAITDLLAASPAQTVRPADSPMPAADVPHRSLPADMRSLAKSDGSDSHPPIAALPAAPRSVELGGHGTGEARRDVNVAIPPRLEVEPTVSDVPRERKNELTRGCTATVQDVATYRRVNDGKDIPASEVTHRSQPIGTRKQGTDPDHPAADRPSPQWHEPPAPPMATTARWPIGAIDQARNRASTHLMFAPTAATGETIETRYGGVLYLLNAALHLDFYPDFTRPQSPGLALSPWTFLALSGERLAGRGLREDALWALLATLATGADEQTDMTSTASHPPPFLPDTLRPYFGTPSPKASRAPETWPAWIDLLIPPLRRRLAAALGVPPRLVGRLVCCQAARIQCRNGRLDAHFKLSDHPIAIRRAGLDRDPGWIPAAACDIHFFYET